MVESAETGNGSNPERPIGCLVDCPNAVVGQALIGSVVSRLHPAQDQQSSTPYQQASRAVLANGMRAELGRAVRAIHSDQRFILHAEETGVRPDPELAVSVFVNDPDEAVSESFGGAECAEAPVLISDQPAAFRSRPQRSVFRDEQRIDAVVQKSGRVLAVEDQERHAVETRQPAARAYPQITVLSLRQRLREVFGQTIRAAPNAAAVGWGVRRRGLGHRRIDAAKQDEDCKKSASSHSKSSLPATWREIATQLSTPPPQRRPEFSHAFMAFEKIIHPAV